MYLRGQSVHPYHNQRSDFMVTSDYRPTMRYYAQDRFPFAQGPGGPYDVWPATPGLDNPPFSSFPVAQPGAICAAGSGKMSFFRPNQALVRGVVGGGMRGMGVSPTSLSPMLLLGGAIASIGALLLGTNLLRHR